jgi:hypothetical protein
MTLRWIVVVVTVGALFLSGTPARADLADLIPNLFGPDGIVLAPPPPQFLSHEAHYRVDSTRELTNINDALKGQLATFPLPSPASGFTFKLDPATGVFERSTQSFGPLFADRAETIGRGRLAIGFTYQHFTFDELDGVDLRDGSLALTFRHEPTAQLLGFPQPFFFEGDTVTAQIFADIESDLFVLTGTYGILDNLDVAIAIPIVRTQIDVTGMATINHIATAAAPDIHRFPNGTDFLTVKDSEEDTGIGDIVLRGKYNFYRSELVSLAAALDLRLPTGDADNLRGLDTVRVSPFFIASGHVFGFSPHVNLGFDIGDTSKIENEFFYRVGFDWSIVRPVTFAFDVLGRLIIDNERPKAGRPPGSNETADDNIVSAAFGVKVNPWRNLLVLFNLLVPLNDTGLRDDITPLIGLEWTF